MKRPKLEDSKKIGNMSLAGVSIDYRKHLQELNEYINFLENELSKLHQPTVSGSISTHDLIEAFLEWMESDDCWITDKDGNTIKDAVIDGKDFEKCAMKYFR